MNIYDFKSKLPKNWLNFVRKMKQSRHKKFVSTLPELDKSGLENILIGHLGLRKGDTVFVHSSLDNLNLKIPIFDVLNLLIDIVGEKGNLIFPTYPPGKSFDFLKSGKTFNVKRTPSNTGLLTEIARRHKKARRSLHPSKSVAVIGPDAEFLTCDHHKSIYPYDDTSPYFRIMKLNAKIIGIGVESKFMSFVHTLDDFYKEKFPIEVYHNEIFSSKCIDAIGKEHIVKTYAHDMSKMGTNIPKYLKKYVPKEIAKDKTIDKMNFFLADAKLLFGRMQELLEEENITIYPKSVYKKGKRF